MNCVSVERSAIENNEIDWESRKFPMAGAIPIARGISGMTHIVAAVEVLAQFLLPALVIAWADHQRQTVAKKRVD
jgi:hypothetical protein